MIGYDSEGKRLRKSFYGKTQKEVRDKVAEFKRQQQLGLTTDADILFRDWAQQWYEGYKDAVSPTTYEGYRYTLKLLKDSLGRKKLRTIKPLDVENFFKELKEDGRSDSYITKCRGMLYQILHKAEANDLIIKNPVRFAEKSRKTQEAKPKEIFTKDEVKILIDKLPDNRIGHSIRLMLATGLRGQEMVALQPEHIAEDGSMLYVRQAVKMVKGTAVIGNTKSSDGPQLVQFPGCHSIRQIGYIKSSGATLAALLRRIPSICWVVFNKLRPATHSPLLPSHPGKRGIFCISARCHTSRRRFFQDSSYDPPHLTHWRKQWTSTSGSYPHIGGRGASVCCCERPGQRLQ